MHKLSKPPTLSITFPVNPRIHYLILLLLSGVSLAVAWYFQNVMGYAPCPLCIVQRYAFWLLFLLSFIGLLYGSLFRWLSAVAVACGGFGVAVAAYHNWVIMHPSNECVPDQVERFVNELPMATWWPDLFESSGLCVAKLPPMLGLTMPQWSLAVLLFLTLGFVGRCIRR